MMKMKFAHVLIIMVAMFSVSCEYGQQAEEKLSEINKQADELDALVNEGIEKVTELDSVLPETSKRLRKADSIIKDASATLDSLNKKVDAIENIFN